MWFVRIIAFFLPLCKARHKNRYLFLEYASLLKKKCCENTKIWIKIRVNGRGLGHKLGVFPVTDNFISNRPLGHLLCSLARTAHSAHSLRFAVLALLACLLFTSSLTHVAQSLVLQLKFLNICSRCERVQMEETRFWSLLETRPAEHISPYWTGSCVSISVSSCCFLDSRWRDGYPWPTPMPGPFHLQCGRHQTTILGHHTWLYLRANQGSVADVIQRRCCRATLACPFHTSYQWPNYDLDWL